MSKDIATPAAGTAKINKLGDPGYKIHVDTQQEIDQDAERKLPRPRNEETGEIIPVAIAALAGGDGEGIYVMPKQYVRIEVDGGILKLTPKNARLTAAELIKSANALAPRKRRKGNGKKRGRKTSMGQGPMEVDGVRQADPIVVEGHVGPTWAKQNTVERDGSGHADAILWSSENVEVATTDSAAPIRLCLERYDKSEDGVWTVGEMALFIDNAEIKAESVPTLLAALTKMHGDFIPQLNEWPPVAPAWATETDPADGSVYVYSRASDTTVREMVANGRRGVGPRHVSGLYQCSPMTGM